MNAWIHDGHLATHETYMLSCGEYEALAERAGGRCEICATQPPQLFIDHDHALGQRAVRGLVCPRCNQLLAAVDAGRRAADRTIEHYYFAAFHFRIAAKRPRKRMGGVPADPAWRTSTDFDAYDKADDFLADAGTGLTMNELLSTFLRWFNADPAAALVALAPHLRRPSE